MAPVELPDCEISDDDQPLHAIPSFSVFSSQFAVCCVLVCDWVADD